MFSLLQSDADPYALRFLEKHRDRVLIYATPDFVTRLHYARRGKGDTPPPGLPIRVISVDEPDALTEGDMGKGGKVVIVADPAGEERRLAELRGRHPGRRFVGLAGDVFPALVARAAHTVLEDTPLLPRPALGVILFASPRSGSSLVADVLSDMGLGDVREHLRGGVIEAMRDDYAFDRAAALEKFVRLAQKHGCFGTKIITHFFDDFVRGVGDLESCRRVFDGMQLAVLTLDREDKVAQAVSGEIASRRGVWHITDAASEAAVRQTEKVRYQFSSLLSRYLFYRQQSELIAFLGTACSARLALSYEQDVEAGDLETLARKLGTALLLDGRDWTFKRALSRKRIADESSAELAEKFSRDFAAHFPGPV